MATNFPNLAGTEGAVVMEVWSEEGVVELEGITLTWEVSSGVMLMVLGGDVFRVGEVVLGWEILLSIDLAEAAGVSGGR